MGICACATEEESDCLSSKIVLAVVTFAFSSVNYVRKCVEKTYEIGAET